MSDLVSSWLFLGNVSNRTIGENTYQYLVLHKHRYPIIELSVLQKQSKCYRSKEF